MDQENPGVIVEPRAKVVSSTLVSCTCRNSCSTKALVVRWDCGCVQVPEGTIKNYQPGCLNYPARDNQFMCATHKRIREQKLAEQANNEDEDS